MIVRASCALLGYELVACRTRLLRKVSNLRGAWRLIPIIYIVWLIVHLLFEWTADDIASRTARTWTWR